MEFNIKPLNELLVARGLPDDGKVQKFIDNEVIKLCDPLVPLDTGVLKGSATRSTKIGSGEVVYNTPYAAKQYYETPTTRPYDANRGGQWFERMKASHKDEILKGAAKIAGSD